MTHSRSRFNGLGNFGFSNFGFSKKMMYTLMLQQQQAAELEKQKATETPRESPLLTFDQKMQLQRMQQEHEMAMLRLRLELQRSGMPAANVQAVTQQADAAAKTAVASGNLVALKAELDALKRAQEVAKEGGAVKGTEKSVKELIAGPTEGQDVFMRSTNKPGRNVNWRSWERLKTMIPPNFDETKYLANNPDVAAAVKQGAMPSGAYHYVMYGMGAGCQASNDPSGKGHCDTTARSFAGWRRRNRRPGYLAGIFSNWNQRD